MPQSAAMAGSEALLSDHADERIRGFLRRLLGHRLAPPILLALITVSSTLARCFHLDKPGEATPGAGFIFDEKYYVNAARVIAGVPMYAGDTYADASPAGTDPNAEHPQLGKLIIATSIHLLGDNPVAWRITAVVAGTAALLLLYWLVRCAGGGSWLALGVTALAAGDNLWLIHGRIAVLDVYALPFMLAGAAFYLRRSIVVAAVLFGVGACIKEFCLYALFAMMLLEAFRGLRWLWERRAAAEKRALRKRGLLAVPAAVAVTGVTYVSLLAVLDRVVEPYHGGQSVNAGQSVFCDHLPVWSQSCNHITFMTHYASALKNVGGPKGIASDPWQFWADLQPANYYSLTSTVRDDSGKIVAIDDIIAFTGIINPVILVASWFAILLHLWWAVRRRDELSLLVIAWILATWLPPEIFNIIDSRTTYLYYMVVVMPALYIAVARLLSLREMPQWLVGILIGGMMAAEGILYPFRTWTGA
jgi:dolichyl-phosphate-mannose-protein mannosyltransferase